MESFSLKRNLTKLSKPDPSNEMDVFHGMKALSMILILLGHRCLASYGGPLLNPEFFEKVSTTPQIKTYGILFYGRIFFSDTENL